MKKLFLLYLSLGLIACASDSDVAEGTSKTEEELVIPDEVQGTYTGVVPCDDCEGIEIELVLTSGRYNMSLVYQGKTDEIFLEDGTFQKEGDQIQLIRTETSGLNKFLIRPGQLIMLNDEGLEETGPDKERYILYLDEEADFDLNLEEDQE
ncbi:MAG: copper resistance protein NlpE N-terminal domain-containing protein [Saprospiraceae bacterium]|nr:copper resistance protein NlpE N-terminal domain-containing protein [Saprospiraceae bacterium]